MAFRKIEAGLVHAPVDEFIGKTGTIFYDNDLGDFRISDGQTPGGIALSFGGGTGGDYTLPTATTTVKGGVKIDGTTIAITNQVIRVGTVPYSSLSGTPTIPTNNNQLTNGAAYITSAALSGLATETYVTTRGYLTTVAYADVTGKPTLFSGSYADLTNKPTLFSGSYADLTNKPTIPTNNNELTNGAGYITSSSLTGLATETYVTTRGYITSAALSGYALTGAIPTDISQLTDTTNLLGTGGGSGGGTTYITNNVANPFSFSIAGDDSTLREIANGESIKITGAGGIAVTTDAEGNVTVTGTPVSLAGYATETYVTSRGYITGLSFNDLTDKPNLAGTYTFNVAADDSTLRTIGTEETVKFVGEGGITTASDDEGKITITQGTTSSLVNGAHTVSLGSTGTVTFPNGALTVTGNKIRNVTAVEGLSAGSELEVSGAKTVITNGVTSTLGGGDGGLTNQSLFEVSTNKILNAFQVITTLGDGDGGITSELITELDNNGFKIGQRVTNYLGGDSEPLVGFSGWTFGTVGQSQAITFPDATVQSTAWTGIANALRSESNINIEVNLTDSTKRIWQFGEDGALTLPEGGRINAVGYNNIVRLGNDGFMVANGAIFNENEDGLYLGGQNSDAGTYIQIPGRTASENGEPLIIAHQWDAAINIQGGGGIWSFGSDGSITFPDDTVQTTAWTGVADYNNLINKPNLAGTYSWSIAADDSTQLEISAGNLVKIVGTRGVTTTSNSDGQITITGPDLSTYATQSYVTTALSNSGIIVSTTAPAGQPEGKLWYNSASLELYVRYDSAWVAASASFSGDYNDLTNRPTNVSQFTNDANYVSRDEVYLMILELTG